MPDQRPTASVETVSSTFAMTFAGHRLGDEVIVTRLRYSIHEPFSVRASFSMSDAPAVRWVLARDLLRDGLATPSGLGDVRLSPTEHGLVMELRSPHGTAVLHGPIEPVVEFVRRSYELVPAGHENDHFAVDAELAVLTELWANPIDPLR